MLAKFSRLLGILCAVDGHMIALVVKMMFYLHALECKML